MKIKLLIINVLALFFSFASYAMNTGPRIINQMGCYMDNNICFVTVSGDPSGPAECLSTTFIWDSKAINGRETLSLLTAAMHNNKMVKFELGAGCSPLQIENPGVVWINVEK